MQTETYTSPLVMDLKLEAKYLQLEKLRNRFLDELEVFDDELLNTPSPEGKWSINQHIAHLVLVDKMTMGYVQHKLKQQEGMSNASFAGNIKTLLLKLVLLSGKKLKAPAVVATVPEHASLRELRMQWDDVRFRMEDILTDIPPGMLAKCLFRHPYAGPLTASQTLTFLQDHFRHHLHIIQQLKKQLTK